MLLRLSALFALLVAVPVLAQEAAPLPPANTEIFAPLDLPAPTATRAADGRPGADYWQNRNDYTIQAALDPVTHTVTGTVRLDYTNEAPLPLPYLWFHLEQNLFAPDSRGARRTPADSRWRGAFAEGGYRIDAVRVDGRPVEPTVTDTRMRLDLADPVDAQGGTVRVEVDYRFVVPQYGADRMGRLDTERGTVYELAQWYPRIAVYDDVNGWNTMPYLGQGEFYLGYGDFELALTVPTGMTVVATGEHLNPEATYTEVQRERLARARRSDERVRIIEPGEVGAMPRPRGSVGTTTWRYRAENVRDVAWAASTAFILDGANAAVEMPDGSTNDVLILSAYPHEGIGTADEPGWEEATRYGRASILNNSRWYPYPYPVAISVAGVVGGMEYPMLHFSGVGARHMSLFGVIDHELGHNWFPMIVGSDERRYAWMDEGFNSYLNTFSNDAFYTDRDRPEVPGVAVADSARVNRLTQSDAAADFMRQPFSDQPVMTYPDRIRRAGLGWLAYRKPAKGLLILRETLGAERMDAAIETYIERWAYKHPQPADFFRTVEDVTGEDLDWFWRGWFMTPDRYDAALTGLMSEDGVAVATVENRLGLVFPTTVEFRFTDGTVQRAEVPVEAFFGGDVFGASVELGGRTLADARLDPDAVLPDADRSNDALTVGTNGSR